MSVCTFFGHSDCYGLDPHALEQVIEKMIRHGVDTFYVGHQGQFDAAVQSVLTRLQAVHPHIRCSVVLAYHPDQCRADYPLPTLYPEEVALGLPRFAIRRRNRWMLEQADCCVCYICHPGGGAFPFAKRAQRLEKTLVNLGDTRIL